MFIGRSSSSRDSSEVQVSEEDIAAMDKVISHRIKIKDSTNHSR